MNRLMSPKNSIKNKQLGLTPKISKATSKVLDTSQSGKNESLKPEVSNTLIHEDSISEKQNEEEKREQEVINFRNPKSKKLINKRVIIR